MSLRLHLAAGDGLTLGRSLYVEGQTVIIDDTERGEIECFVQSWTPAIDGKSGTLILRRRAE